MGEHQAISTERWGITRDEQDELAAASHRNLAAAWDRGFFTDLTTPFLGLERDENLRPDASIESMAKLKPVFGDKETGTMTAGNSTPLTDGAATVLLASDEWAERRSLPVLAHIVDAEVGAVDFVHGEEGLLAAPLYTVPRLLDRNGLELQDFDFYEIHEAFASQVVMTLKAWEDPAFCKDKLERDEPLGSIDRAKLNVNGSSLAAGHPFARHRRPDRRDAGEAARRAWLGSRADIDLRRRRPGCDRDPGEEGMSDRYHRIANSGLGGRVVKTIGLPQPAEIERHEPGKPVVDGPVLLGAAEGGRLHGVSPARYCAASARTSSASPSPRATAPRTPRSSTTPPGSTRALGCERCTTSSIR